MRSWQEVPAGIQDRIDARKPSRSGTYSFSIVIQKMDVASIIKACDQKRRSVGLDRLDPKERVVALSSWANFEVELGGVAAFFHNSAGAHAREIVAALVQLGAMDEAAAINQGRELLREHSWQFVATSGQFERLTDKFLASTPGLFARINAFVEQHREELEASSRRTPGGRARKPARA